ncbi:hypothetical protein [Aquabacterium sp.]|uniref:hypothetical protein n=1 Tax=Aquabacterium sp. TaxID=1872578 RepID=UPI0035ADC398
MAPLVVITPAQVLDTRAPRDFSLYPRKFLAAGDSWFSIGALNLAKQSNLLYEMEFSSTCAVVHCGSPGDSPSRLDDRARDPCFMALLTGRQARRWDGLLISGGGNDLILALGTTPIGTPPRQRLLLTQPEWGDAGLGTDRYISEDGWAAFATYIRANLDDLIKLRDSGINHGVPIFMHTYAYLTPRHAPAVRGTKAWVAPALHDHGIPPADWTATCHNLQGRLADLLLACAGDQRRYPNLHVFDTTTVPLLPASPSSTGESGDWMNETHLAWRGYEKLALPWARGIEAVLQRAAPV